MRGREPVQYFQAPPEKVSADQYAERHLHQLNDQFVFAHRRPIRRFLALQDPGQFRLIYNGSTPPLILLSRGGARPWLGARQGLRGQRHRAMSPATVVGNKTMAFKERVFSGVQPTGNYLGAITKFVALQDTYDCIYCVVDMHAITVWQDPPELTKTTREVTAAFLACGIDPKKQIIFNQSQVAEHAELAWVFNCVARLGWLNRMTQFKEKAGKDRENVSVGLYAYPNLMAADILVYRATHVPVGEDQKQHLELARDIAQKFNVDFAASIKAHGYGEAFFPQPEPIIQGPATRVMSLRDGSKKMSKSEPSDYSRINLTDDAEAIAQKIRKAKTDPEPLPSEEKGLEPRPEADNLVGIYAALQGTSKVDVLREFGGAQFSTFKAALVDLAVAKLGPIGSEMKKLMQDPVYIDSVLADGSARAQVIAAETMKAVKDIVGFVRR
jgi:tryptophanyl-tRNA synthetase